MRAMRKKLNLFTLQLPIYYMLEQETSIGANDISSHPDVFCKKGILKNFAKCTGKHLCQSLFCNKVAGLGHATLLKKRLWHRFFPVNFAKYLKISFQRKRLVAASEMRTLQK